MAKTKSKHKLPKQIAGVRLPKQVRKSGGKLLAWATTPGGQRAIAAGLTSIVAAAGARSAVAGEGKHLPGLQPLLGALAAAAGALLPAAAPIPAVPKGVPGDQRPH